LSSPAPAPLASNDSSAAYDNDVALLNLLADEIVGSAQGDNLADPRLATSRRTTASDTIWAQW
jgi:hypothetical protein